MAYTIDDIKQLALEKLGFEDSDLTDMDEKIAQRLNKDYPLVKNTLLESYKWRFATKTEKLADPDDVTDFKYKYKHTFPTSMKRFTMLYSDEQRNCAVQDYEVQDGFLFSNNEEIHCTYITEVDESIMSEMFVQLLSGDIAIHHCFDFTGDQQLEQTLTAKRGLLFKNAKNVDFQQKKVSVQRKYPYISVRG